jgi:hypothetical protein
LKGETIMATVLQSSAIPAVIEPASSRGRAAGEPVERFRRVMGIGLAIDALLGLWLLLWPGGPVALLDLGEPADPLARAAGLMVLGLAIFALPALIRPLRQRMTTLLSTAMRAALCVLFLLAGGGFLWLSLYQLALALAQGLLYWRAWLADLMSKP